MLFIEPLFQPMLHACERLIHRWGGMVRFTGFNSRTSSGGSDQAGLVLLFNLRRFSPRFPWVNDLF